MKNFYLDRAAEKEKPVYESINLNVSYASSWHPNMSCFYSSGPLNLPYNVSVSPYFNSGTSYQYVTTPIASGMISAYNYSVNYLTK